MKEADWPKATCCLHPPDILDNKGESKFMDLIVSFPRTQRGHDSMWVVVDRTRKLTSVTPTKPMVIAHELAY